MAMVNNVRINPPEIIFSGKFMLGVTDLTIVSNVVLVIEVAVKAAYKRQYCPAK